MRVGLSNCTVLLKCHLCFWVECDHLLTERSPSPQPSKSHHICEVYWLKYQIPVTLNISSLRSYVIQACWLMLSVGEHSNERRAGATSLEAMLKTSKKRLWMSHSVPYVVCHRLVSCLLVVVGTSQPWQIKKKKNIVALQLVLVLLLLLKWTWSESPSALNVWTVLSMCHSF